MAQPPIEAGDKVTAEASCFDNDADLRSLDAIHLASAEQLGMDLRGFVTYDERLASAAAGRGLRVIQPA